MFILKTKYEDALSKQVVDQYIEEMVIFFSESDPFHYQSIGYDNARKFIALGIAIAKAHGFEQRDTVRLYLQLMMYLGSYFDTDPALRWANYYLKQSKNDEQVVRINGLRDLLLIYLDKVCGPNGEYMQAFMQSFTKSPLEDPNCGNPQFIFHFLCTNYPQKVDYITKRGIEEIILDNVRTAQELRLKEPYCIFIFTMMRLIFGHRFERDYLFPWAGNILNKSDPKDGYDKPFLKMSEIFFNRLYDHVNNQSKEQGETS